MGIFSAIYEKVMGWSRHRLATYWLALVSFTESSFFLIPPDVMLAPMTLAKPHKAWFYAGLTTLMSVLGGLLGYLIGLFAIDAILPWLSDLGYMPKYELAQAWFEKWGFWAILMAVDGFIAFCPGLFRWARLTFFPCCGFDALGRRTVRSAIEGVG